MSDDSTTDDASGAAWTGEVKSIFGGPVVESAMRGWPVLPCRAGQKTPAIRHGCLDATSDIDRLLKWWDRWPDHNVAYATGHAFDVLDLDGEEGMASFSVWCAEHRVPIDYESQPIVETPSGGMHLYFLPTGTGNRAGMLPNVDWRGNGGYVVAPPSLHPNGGTYGWLTDPETPIPPCPDALRELVVGRPFDATKYTDVPRRRLDPKLGDGTKFGLAALEDEARRVRDAPPGARNHQLNESAFALYQLVAGGQLAEQVVTETLGIAAGLCGLGEAEAGQTLRSARKAGMAKPRAPKDRPSR